MLMSSVQETIAAIGYAKVIVAFKPAPPAAPAEPAAAAIEALRGVRSRIRARLPLIDRAALESALGQHFIIPNQSQVEHLAASAVRAASKRFKRAEPLESRRVRVYAHLGLALGYVDAAGAKALDADDRVSQVAKAPELSLIRPVESEPAKLSAGTTWGITRIGADRLWAAGFTGKGVIVGHLDTGVDGTHPALQGAIAAFAELDMAGEQVPGAKPTDSGQHGTHTAGTIVGRAGTKGAFGVAPEAQLVSGMVIEGGEVINRILSGMDWIVEQGARILSMSLGIRGFTPAFQTVMDALRAANVLPVIAAGNDFANTSRSPGNYANVLSIGAMDPSDKVAEFSSSQSFNRPVNPLIPDIVAPGVGVLSCIPGNQYAEMAGTSMATPHVAGLAALLLQAKPEATTDDLEKAIVGSCALPASMPQPRANHGVPDAAKAYTLLTGASLPAPTVAATPGPRKPAKVAKRPKAKAGKRAAAQRSRAVATRRSRRAKAKTR